MLNHTRRSRWLTALLLGGCLSMTACGDDDDGGGSSTANLTDGQIGQVMLTASQGEVDLGQLAIGKATAADVRQLATTMVTDHTASRQALQTVLDDRGIAAASSSTSVELQQDAEDTRDSLNALSGAAFDRAYVESQVKMHEDLLDLIDDELLDDVDDDQLRSYLTTTRGAVQHHLQMAQQVEAGVGHDAATQHDASSRHDAAQHDASQHDAAAQQ